MTTVAVLGLGAMGARVARRLLDAGVEVLVWNRSGEKAIPLVEAGASAVESPAAAVQGSDAVITMLSGPEALRTVTEGPAGIVEGANGPTTVIEMSTVGPAAISRLASVLPRGVSVIDAPVLGSTSEVEAGTLKIFVGASEEEFERWTPILAILGEPMHAGPVGSGAAAKLVANSTLLGTLGVLGEAIALGESLGLSRDVTFEVLAASPLAAQAVRRRGPLERGEFPLRFTLELARKDAALITDAAKAAGTELPVARAVHGWFTRAEEAGWGGRDYSSILEWISRKG